MDIYTGAGVVIGIIVLCFIVKGLIDGTYHISEVTLAPPFLKFSKTSNIASSRNIIVETNTGNHNDDLNITPAIIHDFHSNLGPLKSDSDAKRFEEIKVSWKVKLFSAWEDKENYVLYMTSTDQRMGVPHLFSIYCNVPIKKYPKIKVLDKNKVFTVNGIVATTGSWEARLRDCDLIF
ncbi:MAG: hypothetical protein AAB691_04975 [Patescibacteria group bacterium]